MLIPKTEFIRNKSHRKFIASLPCIVTGASDTQCCHIRKGNPCGVGLKPSDIFCVPLSCEQHRIQHTMSETDYYRPHLGVNRAIKLAKDLYKVSGDRGKALELIMEWRNEINEIQNITK